MTRLTRSGRAMIDYFHLSGGMLGNGSVIKPGNYGRIVLAAGIQHDYYYREMALEMHRRVYYPGMPSRLECCFACPTELEARTFKAQTRGFQYHAIYRVSLAPPDSPVFIVDSRLCTSQGLSRPDWPETYWSNAQPHSATSPWIDPRVPGIGDWQVATEGRYLRECLTMGDLRIEERLD